jgi:hypothetical protein
MISKASRSAGPAACRDAPIMRSTSSGVRYSRDLLAGWADAPAGDFHALPASMLGKSITAAIIVRSEPVVGFAAVQRVGIGLAAFGVDPQKDCEPAGLLDVFRVSVGTSEAHLRFSFL